MNLNEAVKIIEDYLTTFDSASVAEQSKMKDLLPRLQAILDKAEAREKASASAYNEYKRKLAGKRKAVRDELIPQWCAENLEPGMVVKVKTNSQTKLRRIESITLATSKWSETIFVGRHVSWRRNRNEDKTFTGYLVDENYITDHVVRNIQGIVRGCDGNGRHVIIPIMDLVEGKATLD